MINSEHSSREDSRIMSSVSIKGKDLFSSSVWQDESSTSVFYSFIASLRKKINEEVKNTSQTHKLIQRIRNNKKLLRCYTQNIDGLEAQEGLCMDMSRGKGSRSRFTKKCMNLPNFERHVGIAGGKLNGGCEVVQLHGELENVRCTICQKIQTWSEVEQISFLRGEAPVCGFCKLDDVVRRAAGKRGSAVGTLRPNIVLYGESNPMEKDIGTLLSHDLRFSPDLLLIMGTSLKVHGLKTIIKEFAKAVHAKKTGVVLFINLTEPTKSVWKDVIDYWVEMDCDEWSKDKMRLTQSEIKFKTKEEAHMIPVGKENVPSTPATKRYSTIGNLPTPSLTKNKKVLAELDPVSGARKNPSRRILPGVKETPTNTYLTPQSSKRRKISSDFQIWDSEYEAIVIDRQSEAMIEASPSKGRKRKLL